MIQTLASAALAAYALGQPLEDAREVRPPGKTGQGWTLKCSNDADAPEQLSSNEPGITICWPMKEVAGKLVRSGYPKRGAKRVETELRFVDGIITRIEITRYYEDGSTVRLVKDHR